MFNPRKKSRASYFRHLKNYRERLNGLVQDYGNGGHTDELSHVEQTEIMEADELHSDCLVVNPLTVGAISVMIH